jgi:hypothetical protein
MSLRNRTLARAAAGALAMLTAGALAAPAAAAGHVADLSIEASAGTIAAGAPSKFAKFNLNNRSGRLDAEDIVVTLDISRLDQSKVHFNLDAATGENGPVCEQPLHGRIECRTADNTLPAGIQVGWFYPLERIGGATGHAGFIRASITHGGADPRGLNNSALLKVRVGSGGPDMFAVTDDADRVFFFGDDGSLNWTDPLRPGEVSTALYMIVNQGDAATTGMRITITLPRGTAFADADGPLAVGCGAGPSGCTPDRCEYAGNNRSVTCTYRGFPLIPADQDTDTGDDLTSRQGFLHQIVVDGDVTAPATLAGGSVRVQPLIGRPAKDVDTSDNADGFSALVS